MSFGNITEENWKHLAAHEPALGNPRRECLIRKHHRNLEKWMADTGEYPLQPENSCQFCQTIQEPELPDYFKILQQR